MQWKAVETMPSRFRQLYPFEYLPHGSWWPVQGYDYTYVWGDETHLISAERNYGPMQIYWDTDWKTLADPPGQIVRVTNWSARYDDSQVRYEHEQRADGQPPFIQQKTATEVPKSLTQK